MSRILLFFCCFLLAQQGFAGAGVAEVLLLPQDQVPAALKRFNPTNVYVLHDGALACRAGVKQDVIIDLKAFLKPCAGVRTISYRLVFQKGKESVDSAWQLTATYRLEFRLINHKRYLSVYQYDAAGKADDPFRFNYASWLRAKGEAVPTEAAFFQAYTLFDSYARNFSAASRVWLLSVGIDDYSFAKLRASKLDAEAYVQYFQNAYRQLRPDDEKLEGFHPFLLLDRAATKDSILGALKNIAAQASFTDYFVFVYNGMSTMDSVKGTLRTFFLPYGAIDKTGSAAQQPANWLSLTTLQSYIQQIPANKQLFISEAGPSAGFRNEFIRTLMQNSPDIASLLNKNRVVLVPNEMGYEGLFCGSNRHTGLLARHITTLDSTYLIWDLFDEKKAGRVETALLQKSYACPVAGVEGDYFEVFSERRFLQDYREVFGSAFQSGLRRGGDVLSVEAGRPGVGNGRKKALLVGSNTYRSANWSALKNPVYDATEVAEVLRDLYGFEITLLTDPPMDSVYSALGQLYKTLQPSDQLIVYFAGHGDFDDGLLDDGFIVCSDSKPYTQDPVRNSYIQHTKLKKMINKIPARQVLVVLDICHGGLFDENVLGGRQRNNGTENTLNRNVQQFLVDKAAYKSRWMLTSVGKESAFDGVEGKHSPFANLLLQVLRGQAANPEGMVTLSGIYSLLQQAGLNENETLKIAPHKAGFGDNEALSEFILLPVLPLGK